MRATTFSEIQRANLPSTGSDAWESGETVTFAELYEHFRQPIHSYSSRLLVNREDADDITQSEYGQIAAVRGLQKSFGFDPTRYRPSSEALLRRVLKGQGLYHINTAVDVNNLCSLEFLLPMCIYDLRHVKGQIRSSLPLPPLRGDAPARQPHSKIYPCKREASPRSTPPVTRTSGPRGAVSSYHVTISQLVAPLRETTQPYAQIPPGLRCPRRHNRSSCLVE